MSYNLTLCFYNKNIHIRRDFMKYGMLAFIEEIKERSKSGKIQWKMKCDCGKIVIKEGSRVKSGSIKSCGCLRKKTKINPNDKFGKLLVLERCKKNDKQGKPKWICVCECGNKVEVSGGSLSQGNTKSCGCLYKDLKREKSGAWKGGKTIDSSGYVLVLDPEHPNSNKKGYVREHMKVMSKHLNRPILKTESIHHKNGNRKDNRLENLELWNKAQPFGQRIEDKIFYAWEIINTYDPCHHNKHKKSFLKKENDNELV